MARINIEDSLWSDPRFLKLCVRLGDEEKAVGRLIIAWRLAQKFWCPDKKPIPKDAWTAAGLGMEIFEVGLSRETEDGIYLAGIEEQFAWWFQRQSAGRRGGLAKAEKLKSSLATASDRLAKPSGVWQNVPSSSSSSSKTEENTKTKTRRVRSEYDPLFEEIYSLYPRKEGKSKAYKLFLKLTEEERPQLKTAVETYARVKKKAGTELQYLKHFSTFMNEWHDWLDPLTGTQNKAPVKFKTIEEVMNGL